MIENENREACDREWLSLFSTILIFSVVTEEDLISTVRVNRRRPNFEMCYFRFYLHLLPVCFLPCFRTECNVRTEIDLRDELRAFSASVKDIPHTVACIHRFAISISMNGAYALNSILRLWLCVRCYKPPYQPLHNFIFSDSLTSLHHIFTQLFEFRIVAILVLLKRGI
jgi:hypothetical protein